MKGKVFLVGAGPGDFGLLTVKGKDCIEKAEVLIYDYLADKRLLTMVKPDAELIYVGKKAGNHTMKQEDISQLVAAKAAEGKCVVRLKGGDPFVFGRGGEEALVLAEKGIDFEIVPGISSSIAAAAYAGIPVTHRHVAASFAVITGHEDPTKGYSSINWEHLAQAVDTLVFLMGVGNLPHITAELMKYGRSAATPVALVRWGTKTSQEVLVSTLGEVAEEVVRRNFKAPAAFIVGDVVKLRDKIQWFDNKPLFGKRVLVTRARQQASKLTEALEKLGADCIEAPTIQIVDPEDGFKALDESLTRLSEYQWLIFTSTNGVDQFFRRLYHHGLDARALAGLKVATIGQATARRLENYGLKADKVPKVFMAEGIIKVLAEDIKEGTKILIPRAVKAREILPQELAKLGAEVDVVPAYATKMADTNKDYVQDLLREGKIDLVTFTSSSTVENFLKLIDGDKSLLEGVKIASIGPITSDTLRKNGLNADVEAEEFTIPGLVEKINELEG